MISVHAHTKQSNFEKIVIHSTYVWFCYLFNRVDFHLCVTGISVEVAFSITTLVGLVTLTFDL